MLTSALVTEGSHSLQVVLGILALKRGQVEARSDTLRGALWINPAHLAHSLKAAELSNWGEPGGIVCRQAFESQMLSPHPEFTDPSKPNHTPTQPTKSTTHNAIGTPPPGGPPPPRPPPSSVPQMLPTPSTSHVDTSLIYEPAEDSYLLLDTLSSASETAFLTARFNPPPPHSHPTSPPTPPAPHPARPTRTAPLILEIGPGSGILLAFLTAHALPLFGHPHILTLGVDINPYACRATCETVRRACAAPSTTQGHGTFLGALQGDLSAPLREGEVDILVFNPPYVPTAAIPTVPTSSCASTSTERNAPAASTVSEHEHDHLLELSWAGGHQGLQVTNRLLAQLPRLLSKPRGVAYVLLCQQNAPGKVAQRIRAWGAAWAVEVVGRSGKTAGWEKLVVLRIWRA